MSYFINKRYDLLFPFSFCCKLVLWLLVFLLLLSLLFSLNLRSLLIELHELGEIELGLLDQLHFPNQNVLDWENLGAFLLDLLSNGLLNEFFGKILESRLLSFIDHNFHHLFADNLLLRALSVAGSFNLLSCSLGEPNREDSEHVPIRGLGLHEGLNHVVPFLHELAEFVLGHVHPIEVGVAVRSLHLFHLHLHLSPSIP